MCRFTHFLYLCKGHRRFGIGNGALRLFVSRRNGVFYFSVVGFHHFIKSNPCIEHNSVELRERAINQVFHCIIGRESDFVTPFDYDAVSRIHIYAFTRTDGGKFECTETFYFDQFLG